MASNNCWLDLAEYDLETAEVMFISKRYLYVGLMCHQTIEKALKAIYSKKYNEVPPRIHNLARLLKLNNLGDEIPDDLLEILHRKRQSDHTFQLRGDDEIMGSSSAQRSWFLSLEKQNKNYGKSALPLSGRVVSPVKRGAKSNRYPRASCTIGWASLRG